MSRFSSTLKPHILRPTQQVKFISGSIESPRVLRFFLITICISFLFGGYFGIALSGNFSLSPSLISVYVAIFIFYLYSEIQINKVTLSLYVLSVISGCISLIGMDNLGLGFSSYMYFIVLYFPFFLQIRNSKLLEILHKYSLFLFLDSCFLLSLLAVFQFFIQFVIKDPVVFNIGLIIPEVIRYSGMFNTSIPVGGLLKANGFFELEPSVLSGFLGFALLIEYLSCRRINRIISYALGMLLSFSGTGMLILLIALFFPSRLISILRILTLILLIWIFLTFFDEFLLDGYFWNRLMEFGTVGSSGYARFIAPAEITAKGMDTFWAALVGNGPGSIRPAIGAFNARYEIHDPTWAKMLYEYGLLGSGLIISMILSILFYGRGPIELKIAFLYAWLASGGQLLSPQFCASMFLIVGFWPADKSGGRRKVNKAIK